MGIGDIKQVLDVGAEFLLDMLSYPAFFRCTSNSTQTKGSLRPQNRRIFFSKRGGGSFSIKKNYPQRNFGVYLGVFFGIKMSNNSSVFVGAGFPYFRSGLTNLISI